MSEIELEHRITSPSRGEEFEHSERISEQSPDTIAPDNAVSLPPTDGGFDAWTYLACAFFLEMIVWSYPSTHGIYLQYYATHTFPGQTSSLSNVGSTASGLLYMSSVVVLLISNRYPWYKRHTMAAGMVITVLGLIGAAYATEPWHLVLTQGALFGIGGSLLFFPMSTWMFEWFPKKKGMASGIIFSGAGIGGLVMPLAIEAGLKQYGSKATLICMAIVVVVVSVPCSVFLKPRLPVARSVGPVSFDTQFARTSSFWVFFALNTLQGLASFIPSLYMPTFTSDLNLSSGASVAVLSVMYGASAPGYIIMGWLSDRFDLRYSILLCSIGSSLAVLLLWGLAESALPLIIFAFVYGFLASSWPCLWSKFAAVTMEGTHQASQVSSIWSMFVAGKGLGSLLSAPIATALLHPSELTNKSGSAYGLNGYGPLILFTGLSLLATSSASLYRGVKIPGVRRLGDILSF